MLRTVMIKGYILLKSGLHIGGSEAGIHIGGIDNPVIKNPLTNLPYIPGSSLKGKIRFLLEHNLGLVKESERGNIPQNTPVSVVFGESKPENELQYPTRVIFRDANLIGVIDDFQKDSYTRGDVNDDIVSLKKQMSLLFVEEKTEVGINRLTGTASNAGPRKLERVPAGVVFAFEIVLRTFKEEEKDVHLDMIKKGLQLLENDALGGSGSRGSGRIHIFDLTVEESEGA